jgi:hypothetical protein
MAAFHWMDLQLQNIKINILLIPLLLLLLLMTMMMMTTTKKTTMIILAFRNCLEFQAIENLPENIIKKGKSLELKKLFFHGVFLRRSTYIVDKYRSLYIIFHSNLAFYLENYIVLSLSSTIYELTKYFFLQCYGIDFNNCVLGAAFW